MPVFAFLNSGIALDGLTEGHLWSPVGLGIILGLFLGKQLGVFGAVWLTIRLGLGRLPHGSSWGQLYGVAVLAGIGFTMSLFIGWLAFTDPQTIMLAKLSVLTGSILSAMTGITVLALLGHPGQTLSAQELACCPLRITPALPEGGSCQIHRFGAICSTDRDKA